MGERKRRKRRIRPPLKDQDRFAALERRLDTQAQVITELFGVLDDVVLIHLRAIEDILADRLAVTRDEFAARVQKAQELVGLEREISAEWADFRRRIRRIIDRGRQRDQAKED